MPHKEHKTIRHMLGFHSLKDFGTTLIILNQKTFILAIIASITTFITNYIYDDASAVYFMMLLILLDFITGCWSGIKNKNFKSEKLQRIVVPLVLYPLILAICWNMAKYSTIYSILPSIAYALFIGTLSTSLFENFVKLGLIEAELMYKIKDKITDLLKKKK